MIEGITVLSQEVIYDFVYDYSPIAWGAAIAAIVGFIIFFIMSQDGWASLAVGVLFSFLGILIGLLIVENNYEKIPTERNQYKVLIEDGVQMTDFYDHFEVIEQDGEIWIIEDKEINE